MNVYVRESISVPASTEDLMSATMPTVSAPSICGVSVSRRLIVVCADATLHWPHAATTSWSSTAGPGKDTTMASMTPPAPDPDRPCADWSRPSPGSPSVPHCAGLTVPSASRLQITLGDTAVGMPVVTSYLGGSSRTTRLMLAGLTAVPCADDDGTADGTGAFEWV